MNRNLGNPISDDSWREELIRDSDRYRDKWAIWKSAYYAGALTVCGVFIAVAPLFPREHYLMPYITKLLLLLSLISCTCIIWNILIFIRLCEGLGFDRIPKIKEELAAYRDKQDKEFSTFADKARERKLRDRIIFGCLIGSALCLGIALFL